MRPDVMARYASQRLPRYTSYPTAPQFGTQVGSDDYATWLRELPQGTTGSLYLHIPYCRSMCWYCGCHTAITHRDDPISNYAATLTQEIETVAGHLSHKLPIGHIHFGGGTPTILPPDLFAALMARLRALFDIRADAEIAVEIDPRTLTPEMILALAGAGVNRASLGVQTFDLAVQRAINRVQSFEQTAATVDGLRVAGIANINLDLIYGLPLQTVDSCLDTVAQALKLKPQRFSVFGYAHVPSFKKHQQKIRQEDLPDGAERGRQEQAITEAIQSAGYVRIGLDHYALPDDSMAKALSEGRLRRNFQGYTTDENTALLGFGASAIGRLPQGYVQNEVHLLRYAEKVATGALPAAKGYALSDEDRLRADLIERVMCDFRVDIGRVVREHSRSLTSLGEVFPTLGRLEADGLIHLSGPVVEVEAEARPLVRAVAAAFDAYLSTAGTHAPAV